MNIKNTNVIFGVGSINLDEHVIASNFAPYSVCEVGGSCGNVLSLLARCGWHAVPFLYIDDSETGITLKNLLEKEGVDVSHVHVTPDADSVRIKFIHELYNNEDSKRVIKCSGKGKLQINRIFPTGVEIINFLNSHTSHLIPNCFYSDRLFPGIHVVQAAIPNTTIFYYEPNHMKDVVSQQSIIEKCTVIKFSAEIISPHFFDTIETPNTIIICTKGAKGVSLKKRDAEWINIPAYNSTTAAVDSTCAGDCFSASFINSLGGMNRDQLLNISTDYIIELINNAQRNARKCLDAFGLIEIRRNFDEFR